MTKTLIKKNADPKFIRVAELFAGVGGFRLGLEGYNGKSATSGYKKPFKKRYETVFSNQWEPSTKTQIASDIYQHRFGSENHFCKDISKLTEADIPDHDLLIGGFPCQDFSVANFRGAGLKGEKGALWWEIHRLIQCKIKAKKPINYLCFENVDRLLSSPAKQKGQDFISILSSLDALGYAVEWRIINAAEYGFPQKRKRVFLLGFHKSTRLYKAIARSPSREWLIKNGVFAKAFPVQDEILQTDLFDTSHCLNNAAYKSPSKGGNRSPFCSAGTMLRGSFITHAVKPDYHGPTTTLGGVLCPEDQISQCLIVDKSSLRKWQYLKSAKTIKRMNRYNGEFYYFKEGNQVFADALDKPSRTIITSEGSCSPSRTTHIIRSSNGRLRRLAPIELERLNMFPDNYTELASNAKRGFLMGNALVVGVVEKIGIHLAIAASC